MVILPSAIINYILDLEKNSLLIDENKNTNMNINHHTFNTTDNFTHPILHESAHQCGNDPDKEGIIKEMSERFKKQNELFKYYP